MAKKRSSQDNYSQQFEDAYLEAISEWGALQAWMDSDLAFYLGLQWNSNQLAKLQREGREAFTFNKMHRVISLISGYQRQNRLTLKIDAIEGGDDETAAQHSGVIQHELNAKMGYETISDCFGAGCLKTGINLLEVFIDYDQDVVSGNIQFDRVPHNTFMLDPYFTRRDLKDCRYILRRRLLDKEDCKALLPGQAAEIEKIRPRGRDSKFLNTPWARTYRGDKFLRFDQMFWRDREKVTVLIDRKSGQQRDWPGSKQQLDVFMGMPDRFTGGGRYDERFIAQERFKGIVKMCILLEGETYWSGKDPLGIDDYPFVPFIGLFDPEYPELQHKLRGVVRAMRDPQIEANKRRSKMLDIMDTQIYSGFKAKAGSVLDPESLYQTGQGRVVLVKDEKNLQDVEPLGAPNFPVALFQAIEIMDRDIFEIPGITPELFGMAENADVQVAASLSKMRQSAGLRILQDLFDNLRLAQKLLGFKLVKAVQTNYAPPKIQRILNQAPSPMFYDQEFSLYDCVPVEGLLTDTQRQLYHVMLVQYKQMGMPVPWRLVIESSNLENKKDLIAAVEAGEQAQSQAAQAQMVTQAVTDKLIQAEAVSRIASAEGKRAQAEADTSKAALDRVKMVKEIQGMDAERLSTLLKTALEIEAMGGRVEEMQQSLTALPLPPKPEPAPNLTALSEIPDMADMLGVEGKIG